MTINKVTTARETYIQTLKEKDLRPVLFVVQVMSDISKQDRIHNEKIPQMYQNENLHPSSITSRNHQLTQLRPSKDHNIRK